MVLSRGRGGITLESFLEVVDLLSIKIARRRLKTPLWCHSFGAARAARLAIASEWFEYLVSAVIVANTIVTCADVSIDARDADGRSDFAWLAQSTFTFVYIFELCLRLFAHGPRAYFKEWYAQARSSACARVCLAGWELKMVLHRTIQRAIQH